MGNLFSDLLSLKPIKPHSAEKLKKDVTPQFLEIIHNELIFSALLVGNKRTGKTTLELWLAEELHESREMDAYIMHLPKETEEHLREKGIDWIHGFQDLDQVPPDTFLIVDEGGRDVHWQDAKTSAGKKWDGFTASLAHRDQCQIIGHHRITQIMAAMRQQADLSIVKRLPDKAFREKDIPTFYAEHRRYFTTLPLEKAFVESSILDHEFTGTITIKKPEWFDDDISKMWKYYQEAKIDREAIAQHALKQPFLKWQGSKTGDMAIKAWIRETYPKIPSQEVQKVLEKGYLLEKKKEYEEGDIAPSTQEYHAYIKGRNQEAHYKYVVENLSMEQIAVFYEMSKGGIQNMIKRGGQELYRELEKKAKGIDSIVKGKEAEGRAKVFLTEPDNIIIQGGAQGEPDLLIIERDQIRVIQVKQLDQERNSITLSPQEWEPEKRAVEALRAQGYRANLELLLFNEARNYQGLHPITQPDKKIRINLSTDKAQHYADPQPPVA